MEEREDGKDRRITQLRKGILELAIMGVLFNGRHYGYSLVRVLSEGAISLKEGTIYPILSRLDRDGVVRSEWVESDQGPPCKYYSLTPDGRRLFAELHKEFDLLVSLVKQKWPAPDEIHEVDKKLVVRGDSRMHNYPGAVLTIIDDYVERVKVRLGPVPAQDQEEFLREIRSHLYEAYQQEPGDDGVARILAVIRRFGEPAEVVADRLPETMVRSGAKRSLPLQVIGGLLIALFGIPLGFGGAAVVAGILAWLSALVVAYYVAAAGVFLAASTMVLFGLTRVYQPELLNRLILAGFIQMDEPVRELLEQLSPSDQGYIMILFGTIFAACGVGMLWLGRYLLRGVRFLFTLVFDQLRRGAQAVRRKAPAYKRAVFQWTAAPSSGVH